MTVLLIILLAISAVMILFGHLILSVIDRKYIYPRRLAKVQAAEVTYPPCGICPADLPPAIVSQLIFFGGHTREKGKSYTRFTVTLLDLIHRQKVFVTRRADELFFSPLGDDGDLLPFERTLLYFLRDAAGDRLYISLSDLIVYIEAHREEAAELRSRFLREVSADFLARHFSGEISYEKEIHPLMYMGGIAVAGSVGVMLGWIAGNVPLGLVSVGLATAAVFLCLQVFRYRLSYLTDEGIEMQARWKAYGAYLAHLTLATCKDINGSALCDFAVYAAALEQEKTFSSLAPVWEDIAEDHPECTLYDPHFFKKLTLIDNSLLISNIRPGNQDDLQKVIKKGHG